MLRARPALVPTLALVLVCVIGCGPDEDPQGTPDTPDTPDTAETAVAAVTASATPPPAHAVVDYQLGGAYDPDPDVAVVSRDRSAEPAAGLYSICYVNAFQTQPDEAEFWTSQHPDLLLRDEDGDLVEDEGWPGEYLLDTSTDARRAALADVVGAWIDGCADAGFQAVEPDNLDSATRSDGALTMADDYAFATLLAQRAHTRGLAIAQKNAAETTAAQARTVGFDFAVAESCQVFDECDAYTDLYGDHVVEIEYTADGEQNFDDACAARGGEVSVLYRDRDVVPRGGAGYAFRHC